MSIPQESTGPASNAPGFLTVLSWFPESGLGGVNQAVLNLIRVMKADGRWRPSFLVSTDSALVEPATHLPCPVFSLYLRAPDVPPGKTARTLLAFLVHLPVALAKLRHLLRTNGIRIVNCVFPDTECVHFVLLRRLGLFNGKVVLTFQGIDSKNLSDRRGIGRWFARWMLRSADVVVACSRGLLEEILAFEPRCADHATVIYNAVDKQDFLERTEWTYQLPEPLRERPFLLNVARYEHKKGQDILIRAFEQIAGRFPDLMLVLIGASSGPESDISRKLVAQSPLRDRIFRLENVPHERIAVFMQSARLFVLASRREGFPFVILEAGALGVPVVASACIGVPEVITDGETGRLSPVEDANGLARIIEDVLMDEEKRKRMGENLRRLVTEEFSWKASYEKYIAL